MPERTYAAVFAQRFEKVEPSFIREILKVAANPEIISFAGGLPNPPVPGQGHRPGLPGRAARAGAAALQYAATEGFAPLRQYIADRYLARHGMQVNPDNILITSGSQQALDLLGKVLIDEDRISSSRSQAILAPSRPSPSINRPSSPLPWVKRGWIWRRWIRCWRAAPTPSCCTAFPTSRTRAASPTAVPTARHWPSDWSATSC